jgi:hypothetical protein
MVGLGTRSVLHLRLESKGWRANGANWLVTNPGQEHAATGGALRVDARCLSHLPGAPPARRYETKTLGDKEATKLDTISSRAYFSQRL